MGKITIALGATNADEPEDDGAHIDVQEPIPVLEAAEEEPPAEEPVAPDSHAKKADWVDYAVALGHDRAVVESFTKPDIVELVGTRSTSAHADVAAGTGDAGALS